MDKAFPDSVEGPLLSGQVNVLSVFWKEGKKGGRENKREEEKERGREGNDEEERVEKRGRREDIEEILNGSQEREINLFLPTKNTLLLPADLFSH